MSERINHIRRIMLEYSNVKPKSSYHVTSNLNWFRYVSRVKKIVELVPRGSKVLEVGCGWGQVVAMIKALRPDLRVVGSDIEAENVWKELNAYGCRYVQCDGQMLSFSDEEFYAVVSFGVMEHVKDDKKFLREIFRVLNSGGYNFIYDLPNRYGFSELVIGRAAEALSGRRFPHHEARYTKENVRKLLTDCGFVDVHVKNEFLIPAQVNRISARLRRIFNRYYLSLDRADRILGNTPLSAISQSLSISCRKP